MKIFVGVPTSEYSRRADFYDYYNALIRPNGTICSFAHGPSVSKNRNILIDLALQHECTHILFLDDDMYPEPNLLLQLLSHNKDIVTGLYLSRNFPHLPVIFDESYSDGQCKFAFLTPNKSGLIEIVNCGFGAVLIRTDVFKAMEKPYLTLGEIVKDEWCDDVSFFNRVRKVGFKIHCDLDARVGHSLNVKIYPKQDTDGSWYTDFKDGTGVVTIAQQIPSAEEIQRQVDELVAK